MEVFSKILDKVEIVLKAVGICTLTLSFGILFIQIFLRYFTGFSFIWAEELAVWAFIYCCMLCLPLATRYDIHFKVDSLVVIFPKKVRIVVNVIGQLMCLVFVYFVMIHSWNFFKAHSNAVSPGLRAPMQLILISVPLGMALQILFAVEYIINQTIKELPAKKFSGTTDN